MNGATLRSHKKPLVETVTRMQGRVLEARVQERDLGSTLKGQAKARPPFGLRKKGFMNLQGFFIDTWFLDKKLFPVIQTLLVDRQVRSTLSMKSSNVAESIAFMWLPIPEYP